MALILALDQGTSSSRSIVFDEHGHILASAQLETRQHYPHPGWVEHDPMELWTSQRDTAHAALVQLRTQGRDLSEVYAVGITNQRETTVLWRRDTGQPVGPAIVWQDRRTEAQCARWREQGLADLIRAKTGLVIDPYCSGSKLHWLLDHIDGARAAAQRGELAIADWVVEVTRLGQAASRRGKSLAFAHEAAQPERARHVGNQPPMHFAHRHFGVGVRKAHVGTQRQLHACGPVMNRVREPAEWLDKPGAPWPALANERPAGRTLPYQEALRSEQGLCSWQGHF